MEKEDFGYPTVGMFIRISITAQTKTTKKTMHIKVIGTVLFYCVFMSVPKYFANR